MNIALSIEIKRDYKRKDSLTVDVKEPVDVESVWDFKGER